MWKRAKIIVIVVVLTSVLAASLLAYSRSESSRAPTNNPTSNPVSSALPAYTSSLWNVTSIGLTEDGAVSVDMMEGRGVIFDDCFVFWRFFSSDDFGLTAFSLSNYTFRNVWDSNGSLSGGGPGDIKVIDNAVYASYGSVVAPSYFYTVIMYSDDLSTWTEYCVSTTVSAESLAQYTGPGPFFDMIMYGGYYSFGFGTYAAIRAWNSTSNSEIDLFDGTIGGSNDCCFLTMLNSTCMIGGDCGPSNIIYTNDGENWTDEYSAPVIFSYTPQYPFVWGWAVYVSNGTAYVAEESSPYGTGYNYTGLYTGGLMTWSGVGTAAPFDYNMLMESISNGLVGGCGGLFNSNGDYGGPAVVYSYNPNGTLGSLIWRSGYAGSVRDLTYDINNAAWYGTVLNTDSHEVEIIKIT